MTVSLSLPEPERTILFLHEPYGETKGKYLFGLPDGRHEGVVEVFHHIRETFQLRPRAKGRGALVHPLAPAARVDGVYWVEVHNVPGLLKEFSDALEASGLSITNVRVGQPFDARKDILPPPTLKLINQQEIDAMLALTTQEQSSILEQPPVRVRAEWNEQDLAVLQQLCLQVTQTLWKPTSPKKFCEDLEVQTKNWRSASAIGQRIRTQFYQTTTPKGSKPNPKFAITVGDAALWQMVTGDIISFGAREDENGGRYKGGFKRNEEVPRKRASETHVQPEQVKLQLTPQRVSPPEVVVPPPAPAVPETLSAREKDIAALQWLIDRKAVRTRGEAEAMLINLGIVNFGDLK